MDDERYSQAGTYETSIATAARGTLRYTLSLPNGFSPNAGPYPLVLALHYGFDRTAPFPPYYGRGVLDGLVGPSLSDLSPIIAAPDSHGETWTETTLVAAVLELFDALAERYPVDRQRTLLTGFSLGGLGTWSITGSSGNRFRAAIAVAAAPSDDTATAYPNIPLYVIHSEADEIFPIAKVDRAVEISLARGVEVTYKKLNGVTHFNVPGFAAALSETVPWLQEQWEKQPA